MGRLTEWCPYCDTEHTYNYRSSFKLGIAICPTCKHAIAPCSLCDLDKVSCGSCSLGQICDRYNKTLPIPEDMAHPTCEEFEEEMLQWVY